MEIRELHSLFLESSGVTTDTREIKRGDIFFALKGENFDGNDFTEKPLNWGHHGLFATEKGLKGAE
jgi:UDP-N-acetylmuramyl pentapeptide synthase